jgi:hypothetical protein
MTGRRIQIPVDQYNQAQVEANLFTGTVAAGEAKDEEPVHLCLESLCSKCVAQFSVLRSTADLALGQRVVKYSPDRSSFLHEFDSCALCASL